MPPGTTYFCRQAKVGKNWLRGVAPKDPKFLEQGRGEGYFTRRIGRGITYLPRTLRSPPADLLCSGP